MEELQFEVPVATEFWQRESLVFQELASGMRL
jgi:hypothetical protein